MFTNKTFSYTCLFIAQLMVAINVVGAKYLLGSMSVTTVLFFRFLVATVLLLLAHFIVYKRLAMPRLSKREWRLIIAQAVTAGGLFNVLLLLGLHFTSAADAGMIISALPAVIALFAVVVLKERLSPGALLCIGLAVIGLLFINGSNLHLGSARQLVGDFIVLLALIPEAAYYLVARFYQNRVPLLLLSALMNGINLIGLAPVMLFSHSGSLMTFDFASEEVLVAIGVASAIFYIAWYIGSREIKAATSSLYTALAPVLTLIIAGFALGEVINAWQLIGMCFIIFSVVASSIAIRE